MLRATAFIRAADLPDDAIRAKPFGIAVLAHDERHLRRRVIELAHGERLLVDLAEATALATGDVLVLDDGRHAEVVAAEEELYAVHGRDAVHLAELAWHIGNRHLAAAIEPQRILILRDHVIRAMLEDLGARVSDVVEAFEPVRGAYSGHGGHAHSRHDHSHDHHHGDGDHHHRHSHDDRHHGSGGHGHAHRHG